MRQKRSRGPPWRSARLDLSTCAFPGTRHQLRPEGSCDPLCETGIPRGTGSKERVEGCGGQVALDDGYTQFSNTCCYPHKRGRLSSLIFLVISEHSAGVIKTDHLEMHVEQYLLHRSSFPFFFSSFVPPYLSPLPVFFPSFLPSLCPSLLSLSSFFI